jgi:single-strand DNA-binding protein
MNNLSVIGRLGRDPETKFLPDGKAVCSFSIAVDRRSGKKEKEPPMWFQVAAFGKLAEICQQYLKKGRQVAVTGSIDIHEYTARDGAAKTTVNVAAAQVDFLGGGEQAKSAATPATASGGDQVDDSDIPF